jgi:lipoate-protein ligase A
MLFGTLDVYGDESSPSAAMNMAIDEALLERADIPSIRLYRWNSPALSFGYFGRFADVASYSTQRDLVRRWTGGGIVFHGDDLTYSIVIPPDDPLFAGSSIAIYASIHAALRNALVALGQHAAVAGGTDRDGNGSNALGAAVRGRGHNNDRGAGVSDVGYNGHCFANPVRADVLVNGRKVAGAAQRRTRRGLLQQGSIQQIDLAEDFVRHFAKELSENCSERKIENELLDRAKEIAQKKYATQAWLRRR